MYESVKNKRGVILSRCDKGLLFGGSVCLEGCIVL